MNKSSLAAALSLLAVSTSSHAAFLQPWSSGTINLTSGCFAFSTEACTPGSISDLATTVRGFGTGIAGDGLVGVIGFTVGADGNTLAITSYSQDSYGPGAVGDFALEANLAGSSGYVSDSGDVSLTLDRDTYWTYFSYLDGTPWNIDDSTAIAGQGDPVTGTIDSLTTGTDFAWSPGFPGTMTDILNGSALSATGAGSWSGVMVNSGNAGEAKGSFDGTPYVEIFEFELLGVSAVPVPASAWLFGSGLLAILGVTRRREAGSMS